MNNILNNNTFIFDFDGVIVDSVNIKMQAFAKIYSPFGEEIVSKVIAHHLSHGGVNRYDKFRLYHNSYLKIEISESELADLAQRFSKIVFGEVLKAPLITGVLRFIDLLRDRGKQMFVISATPEQEIKRIVSARKLNKYFTDIKGSPTKKEDSLKYIIKQYNVDVSKCVYFGDSQEDYNAAASCHVAFIPINYFDRKQGYCDFNVLIEEFKITLDNK